MRTVLLRLNERDHVGHPIGIRVSTAYRDSPPVATDTRDAARITFDEETGLRVFCTSCGVFLLEGEDYVLDDLEAWQA